MRQLPLCCLLISTCATAQWSQVSTATNPPARTEGVMIYDIIAGKSILFGGGAVPGITLRNDTWAYDGVDWTQLAPATSPTGRLGANMAYDLLRGRGVMFGGITSQISIALPNNQTWEWDGSNWAQVAPAHSPVGLAYHAMAYDLFRQRVVLYGGSPNPGLLASSNQTWEFDGVDWTQVMTANNPGGLQNAAMCFDLVRNRTMLFGGVNPQTGANGNTWVYDGTNWSMLPTATAPSARTGSRMVYDSNRSTCFMYGGFDATNGNPLNEGWEFDGTDWHLVLGNAPPSRTRFTMAFDQQRGEVVLHGGVAPGNAGLNDTWELSAYACAIGSGCLGSNGVPSLSPTNTPRIGTTFQSSLTNLPVGAGLAALASGLHPNHVPLDVYGMTGCVLHTTLDALVFLPVNGGAMQTQMFIPNDISMLGVRIFQQGLSLDPGFNSAGLVVSNAIATAIGH